MIYFNRPPVTGKELEYIKTAIESRRICGDYDFTKKCNEWFERTFSCKKALLTTSCTHALEIAAMLISIDSGTEVIMPSFTFVSTANAFVLRGAQIVFIDIRSDTMNIDENLIEEAITPKTRVIVPVHYAGVACEMNRIIEIAQKHGLYIIEDAAQGVMSKYRDKYLGTLGNIGCYSFHETKNYTCGEGGAIILNNQDYIERTEIIREKGTNRTKFHRGEVDKYTWLDIGSSYLPSELNAAFLLAQLENAVMINTDRKKSWNLYYERLKPLQEKGKMGLPCIPDECEHNGHMFYIKLKDLEERTRFINHMNAHSIRCVFHYIPLHSSPAGKTFGRFHGVDRFTTNESNRLVRLPLYYGLKEKDIDFITEMTFKFFYKS